MLDKGEDQNKVSKHAPEFLIALLGQQIAFLNMLPQLSAENM